MSRDIDDLYKLPLEEFTRARNALAKGRTGRDKEAIAGLVKPSAPMWIVNQLYWKDPGVYRALVDASEKLRSAHRAALGGRKVDTRKPDELHRTTLEKAFSRALQLAQQQGVRTTDATRDAVRRALSALPTDEPNGRLTREPPAAGFSLLTGIKPRPIAEKPSLAASQRATSAEPSRPAAAEVRRAREDEKRRKAEEQKARKAQERREREIRKAEQALREAERRLAALKG